MQMGKTRLKWGPVCVCLAVTLIFSLTYYYRAPYHDHWDIVPLFAQARDGTLAFGDLFALHGYHWHASGYIVQLGLSQLTSMGHQAESAASVLIAAFGFIALARMLGRAANALNVANGTRIWIYAVSAFMLFSLDQAGNWLWGWQIAVFINVAGDIRVPCVTWQKIIQRSSSGIQPYQCEICASDAQW